MARTWITKVNNVDTVDAAHVNDLQTYKLDKDALPYIRPEDYGAVGDGVADDTAAISDAITASNLAGLPVLLGATTYLVTDSLPKVHYIRGTDMWTSTIWFMPTSSGKILFDCSPNDISANNRYYRVSIENLTIAGGNDVDKTAIRLWHCTIARVDMVNIVMGLWAGDTSTGSIGLNLMGTDCSYISNTIIETARPIVAQNQPTSPRNNLDHITFSNMNLFAEYGGHPLVEFEIGTSQVFFTGEQAWCGGGSAFLAETTQVELTFENIRWELTGSETGQTRDGFRIIGEDFIATGEVPNQSVCFKNCRVGVDTGYSAFYLRNVWWVTFMDVGSAPISPTQPYYFCDIDDSCWRVDMINVRHHICELNITGLKTALCIGEDEEDSIYGANKSYTRFYARIPAISQESGTRPSIPYADRYHQYAADLDGEAGKTCPHFMTEDGSTVRLNQDVSSHGSPEFYTVNPSDVTVDNIPYKMGAVEKLTDGGLEIWASATDLTNWTEATAGTSSVNRDGTDKHGGTYSCRFDCDADSHLAMISQNVTGLTASRPYTLSFWYKSGASPNDLRWEMVDTGANQYLSANGSWVGAVTTNALPVADSWTLFSITFNTHASYTDYTIGIIAHYAPSSSMRVDDISLVSKAGLKNSPLSTDGTDVDNSGVYKVDAVQVVGPQAASQADLKADYTTGGLDTEAEIIAAINATNAGFNTLLAKIRAHGLIDT